MKTFRRASVAALALSLVLAACSDPKPGSSTTATEEPGAQEQPTAESTPSPDATTEASPTEEPTREVAVTGPECLIGTWKLTAEQMQAFFDSIEGPTEFLVEGDSNFEFTADTYEYTPDLSLTVSLAGMEGTGSMTGSVSGSYTTANGVITTSDDTHDIDMSIKVGSIETDGSDITEGFLSLSPINSAAFECRSDLLTITWQNGGDGIDLDLVRVK